MNALYAIILAMGLAVGIFAFLLWFFKRHAKSDSDRSTVEMLMALQKDLVDLRGSMHDQSINISKQMQSQLEQNTRFLQETHSGFNQTVNQVQHRLGQLQEATQNMISVGKDISSLHDILRAPKLRGGLGELFLGELLRQILPEDHFALQYSFRDGRKVDAVILLGQGIIPVDAKFPLENFKRLMQNTDEVSQKQARKSFVTDVKKHIDDISSKYILPEEGTFEFALMYIPAENVYYETIIKDEMQNESIATYALQKKVVPVSPNSFYAYLQAIVRGLKGLRIERSAQLILESLGQLETDFKKSFDDFEKIGAHLSDAQSAYGKTLRRFEKFQDRLNSIEDVKRVQIPGAPVSESPKSE
ncbi:MAG: DNA recombination protein RmuC [Candidatus Omnitrophica bacterium]|nr:DNA recombination protein RmuC [Candidatus Omnitrophota bacterium]MDD5672119.1 DNA recombination protein RmuC [Candidatus Omnitrophota bacterium]